MFHGWVVVIGLWFAYFFAIGPEAYGFGVILKPMAQDMGWTIGQATIGFSLYAVLHGALAPITALSIKKIGIKRTMIVGTILMAFSNVGLVYMNTLWQYYIIVAIPFSLGIAMGTVVPLQATIANWFARKRALALSIAVTAGGFGGLTAAPLMHHFIKTTGTWRTGWMIAGVGAILATLVIALLIRDRPEDMGLLPDGDTATTTTEGHLRPKKVFQTAIGWTAKEAVKTRSFWFIVFASCALILPVQVVLSQSVVYLDTKGVSETVAAAALGLVAFTSTTGRLMAGFLGDHIDPRYILTVALSFLVVGILILMNAQPGISLYMYVIIFGIGYGATYVCFATLLANYFGRDNYASIYGILYPVQTLFGAIGPIVAASVFDATGSYNPAFMGIMVFTIIAVVVSLFTRPPVYPRKIETGKATVG